ncbi:glutathione S-transferase family protein [Bradyrhizobium sp. Pear76]|uniref:glutathione S-transferase family protein n=1 Tax=Bradyrhizobium oropedii TaxID=1571201 RepID=UPI001E4E43E2|nr:glutathione S-transferase family protein [Bradyrhizobium oropedii]MCC8960769.1 glutathione S-transferase family protein [Bradyrhizobium oropedii]
MRLLTGPLSMFGAKAQIAVAEKALSCAVEFVPFGMKRRYDPKHPDVLRINPKAQVPVLIDGTLEIFDSTQIFEYLEHAYPQPPLWPSDAKARAVARLVEHKSDEVFFPNIIRLMSLQGDLAGEDAVTACRRAQSFYDEIEGRLADSDFVAGDYSYADIALIMAHFFAVRLGADINESHHRFDAWRRRVSARPAVQQVLSPMSDFLRSRGLAPPAFCQPCNAAN